MSNRQTFRQEIVDAFSLDELETLCHDLGVDPDRIPGKDQGKDYWTDQIITYFERRDQLPKLLAALQRERPSVAWAYQPIPATPGLPSSRPLGLPIAAWAGIGVMAFVLVVGAAIVLRPSGSASTPTPTQTALATASTAAPPTVVAVATASAEPTATRVPRRMSPLNYNIFIADFGQVQAGRVVSLPEGRMFSESFVESLKLELEDPNVLSAAVRSDLQPQVWSSRDAEDNGWQIGAIAGISEAQRVGDLLGAQLVIYGNMALSDTIGQLDVGYYVPQATNTADELAGAYSLGAPVSTNWPPSDDAMRALKVTVNERQRLISRVAIGLAYDLLGKQEPALTVFKSAVAELNPQCGAGREVLYALIGREHLLLQQSDEAQQAHTVAYDCDNRYVRALIGLGDVSFQYANAITAELRLGSDALKNTYDYYTRAEQNALARPDTPQLITLARLGLGLTKQLEGEAHYELANDDQAKPLLADAIRQIEPALADISRRPDGQKRTLAIGYSRLASAYWYSAVLAPDNEENTIRNYYDLAADNFNKCIALVPPGSETLDPTLTRKLVEPCRENLEKMQATQPKP